MGLKGNRLRGGGEVDVSADGLEYEPEAGLCEGGEVFKVL
jgi:hypothetical protein